MTVPLQEGLNTYTANGATTVFAYQFQIGALSDIEVQIDGVIQTVGFSVSGIGDDEGGNVTFSVAPANGANVALYLNPRLERLTDYQQFGDWLASNVNEDYDRIWRALQSQKKRTDHTLQITFKDFAAGVSPVLPAPTANNFLSWNAAADELVNIPLQIGTSAVDLAAPGGAALVGTSNTITGAGNRDVRDVLRDVVSIFDHGAFTAALKADIRTRALTLTAGAAITAALTAITAAGAAAWCPAGSYNINDGVTQAAQSGLYCYGAGELVGNTWWRKSTNGDSVTLTSQTRGVFKGIALDGTGMTTGNGLVLDGAGSGVFEVTDCQISNFPARGIYANFPSGSPASGVDYYANLIINNGHVVGTPQAEYRYSNDSVFSRNQYGGTVGGPYATIGAYHFQCRACDFGPTNFHWENTVGAKYEECDYSKIFTNRWEENQQQGVIIKNMARFSVVANHWHSNSKASSGTHDGMTLESCGLGTISGGNSCYTFTATLVRDCIGIDSACSSLQIADNVFSGFSRRPVTWDRAAAFEIHLVGNLPTGYAINQEFQTIQSKVIGIAAGQTRYAGIGPGSATEADVIGIADNAFMAVQMRAAVSAAPGAGQSITITLRKNAGDTAHVATISDGNFTAAFQSAVGSEISYTPAQSFSWKVVASAGAATATVTIAQTTAI